MSGIIKPLQDAIACDDEIPEDQLEFIKINAELAEIWPNITQRKDALDGADEQNGMAGKRRELIR